MDSAPVLTLSRQASHRPQGRLRRRGLGAIGSPCDRSLLRGIYILLGAGLEEKGFHVLGEKAARLGVHQVETVVVDEHHLLARPLSPAVLADLARNALADRPWERWALEAGSRLSTAAAFHVRH